jgi:hypothetical protein
LNDDYKVHSSYIFAPDKRVVLVIMITLAESAKRKFVSLPLLFQLYNKLGELLSVEIVTSSEVFFTKLVYNMYKNLVYESRYCTQRKSKENFNNCEVSNGKEWFKTIKKKKKKEREKKKRKEKKKKSNGIYTNFAINV